MKQSCLTLCDPVDDVDFFTIWRAILINNSHYFTDVFYCLCLLFIASHHIPPNQGKDFTIPL